MSSKWEQRDLQRQLDKQWGKQRKKNGADPTKMKDLGRAGRKASQQPTYRFPKPARNTCDTFGQNISTIKCAKCRQQGHTSDQCALR